MIARQAFGSTGQVSTRTIFGAAAFSRVSQEEADRTMEMIIERGVNHIDTASTYGESEVRLGPWMERYRDRFFLASKTRERTYQEARDSIQRSLERLRTNRLDLIQLHNLAEPEEWQIAMGPGGALEATIEARDQGMVRFIGVTGHGVGIPAMHRRSLERFPFDSVLLPYNYVMMQNPQYAADFETLWNLCRERGIAMQTIKGITHGPWPDDSRTRYTWYKPLEEQEDIDRAVHWVLGRPDVFLNTVGDINLLPRVLDAAERFQARTPDEEMGRMVERREMTPLFV